MKIQVLLGFPVDFVGPAYWPLAWNPAVFHIIFVVHIHVAARWVLQPAICRWIPVASLLAVI